MFTYLKEKTIGMASTVGSTVVGSGQAAVQTVLNQQSSGVNASYENPMNASHDVSASFAREMTPSERVQRILSKRRRLNE